MHKFEPLNSWKMFVSISSVVHCTALVQSGAFFHYLSFALVIELFSPENHSPTFAFPRANYNQHIQRQSNIEFSLLPNNRTCNLLSILLSFFVFIDFCDIDYLNIQFTPTIESRKHAMNTRSDNFLVQLEQFLSIWAQ